MFSMSGELKNILLVLIAVSSAQKTFQVTVTKVFNKLTSFEKLKKFIQIARFVFSK